MNTTGEQNYKMIEVKRKIQNNRNRTKLMN